MKSMARQCEYMVMATLTLFVMGIITMAHASKEAPFQLMLNDVEVAVSTALSDTGIADHVRASITNVRNKVLHADSRPVQVSLETLEYDEASLSWSANMIVSQGETIVTAQPLSGRYDAQVELPVLNKRLQHGTVITDDDISMAFFSDKKMRKEVITDSASLVGKTPRRTISNNRPIRSNELEAPAVVERGSVIQMSYNSSSMAIRTMGEALEDGGIGDFIRVRNNDSSQVVRAKVASAQEVEVGHYVGR